MASRFRAMSAHRRGDLIGREFHPEDIIRVMYRTGAFVWLAGLSALWGGAQEPDCFEVGYVWSGHPVGFSLLTAPPDQFVAYYDRERWMTVAQRKLGETNWT